MPDSLMSISLNSLFIIDSLLSISDKHKTELSMKVNVVTTTLKVVFFSNLKASLQGFKFLCHLHCVKSVRIRSFSGQYSVRKWEITDQKYSK